MNGIAITNYDYSNNILTIYVTEKSGTIQFYATPLEAGTIAAYAQFTYTQNNSQNTETIGIIYLDVPLLKLNVPSQTSHASFDVTGVTAASEVVILSINGIQVGTATAKKDGSETPVYEQSGSFTTTNGTAIDVNITTECCIERDGYLSGRRSYTYAI